MFAVIGVRWHARLCESNDWAAGSRSSVTPSRRRPPASWSSALRPTDADPNKIARATTDCCSPSARRPAGGETTSVRSRSNMTPRPATRRCSPSVHVRAACSGKHKQTARGPTRGTDHSASSFGNARGRRPRERRCPAEAQALSAPERLAERKDGTSRLLHLS
jgi:hypothetical protein